MEKIYYKKLLIIEKALCSYINEQKELDLETYYVIRCIIEEINEYFRSKSLISEEEMYKNIKEFNDNFTVCKKGKCCI